MRGVHARLCVCVGVCGCVFGYYLHVRQAVPVRIIQPVPPCIPCPILWRVLEVGGVRVARRKVCVRVGATVIVIRDATVTPAHIISRVHIDLHCKTQRRNEERYRCSIQLHKQPIHYRLVWSGSRFGVVRCREVSCGAAPAARHHFAPRRPTAPHGAPRRGVAWRGIVLRGDIYLRQKHESAVVRQVLQPRERYIV